MKTSTLILIGTCTLSLAIPLTLNDGLCLLEGVPDAGSYFSIFRGLFGGSKGKQPCKNSKSSTPQTPTTPLKVNKRNLGDDTEPNVKLIQQLIADYIEKTPLVKRADDCGCPDPPIDSTRTDATGDDGAYDGGHANINTQLSSKDGVTASTDQNNEISNSAQSVVQNTPASPPATVNADEKPPAAVENPPTDSNVINVSTPNDSVAQALTEVVASTPDDGKGNVNGTSMNGTAGATGTIVARSNKLSDGSSSKAGQVKHTKVE